MTKLVIVQPYVPTYRKSFFDGLIATLAEDGIECMIAAGVPTGGQAARGDAVSAPWILRTTPRELHVLGKTVGLGGSRKFWHQADGVVVGHLGSSLDTYNAIVSGLLGSIRVGLWGHIRNYVSKPHPLDAALERWQLRRADHVFAYTNGGREYAIAAGVLPENVTSVMNTIDTSSLAEALESLRAGEIADFISNYRIDPSRTFTFIGGLDESKRIPFIAEVLDILWERDPSVRLLVAGNGSQKHLLNPAVVRGQVHLVGYADDRRKALLSRVSVGVLMPGRVGLVAVDALTLHTPIITTAWPFHAPEADYLVEGSSKHTLSGSPELFANELLSWIDHHGSPGALAWPRPKISDMVNNFAAGVRRMLA